MLMLPELIVVAAVFMVLLVDLLLTAKKRFVLDLIAMAGLGAAFVSLMLMTNVKDAEMFGGRFALDSVAWWFKAIFLLSAVITVAVSMDGLNGRVASAGAKLGSGGEYYVALLSTVAGMMFMSSARDLVMLYVSLELSTIPLFVLTAWRRDALSGEAGLKYVVLGALGSAILLYGFSFLYGLTGETNIVAIGRQLTFMSPAFIVASVMITAGIGFKMTLVPFHMWAADVYQGAPTPVTAYLSVASKAAGLVLMFQIFFRAMGHVLDEWNVTIAVIAAATMTLGNLVAIVQQNIKRFMAFSAISQAGYLIMGFLGPDSAGIPAMLFYMLVYMLTNLAVFAVIIFHSNQTGSENIADYRGLSRTNPSIALAMMIALFGLAGIPPLSGFVGKFFLFSIASKAGFNWLVAVAAVNSTISLYYYLQIVRQMYIEPADANPQRLDVTPVLALSILVTVTGSVILGVVPAFYEMIHAGTAGWLASVLR